MSIPERLSDLGAATGFFRLHSRNRTEIRTMEDWRLHREAVNSGWVPGKSAWETANAWVGDGKPLVPADLKVLLTSHESTRKLVFRRGVIELKTHLHHRPPSGPRNHDLGLWSNDEGAFVGIESKADDGFAGTMSNQIRRAKETLRSGGNTRLRTRLEWLSQSLMGLRLIVSSEQTSNGDEMVRQQILELPYQLFAGVAGTLLEAKACGANLAVFAVHQFRTHMTNHKDIEADSAILNSFASHLLFSNPASCVPGGATTKFEWGRLIGPIWIRKRCCGDERWDMPTDVPLFIGKSSNRSHTLTANIVLLALRFSVFQSLHRLSMFHKEKSRQTGPNPQRPLSAGERPVWSLNLPCVYACSKAVSMSKRTKAVTYQRNR
jgi:hypothetical protein